MKFLLILLVFGIGLQIKAQTATDQDEYLKRLGYTRFKSQQAPDLLNPAWRIIIDRLVNYCENSSSEKSSETFYYDLPDDKRKKIAGDLEKSTVEYLALKKKLDPIIARMEENIRQIKTSLNSSVDCLNLQSSSNNISVISRLITDNPKFKSQLEEFKKYAQLQNENIEKQCKLKKDKVVNLNQERYVREKLLQLKYFNMNSFYLGLTLAPIQIWKFESGPCESLEIKRSTVAFENPASIKLITRKPVGKEYRVNTNEIIIFDQYLQFVDGMLIETADDKVELKRNKDIPYKDLSEEHVVTRLIKNLSLSLTKTPPSSAGTYINPAKAKHAQ